MKDRQRTAVFPGSFDPFTVGHLDVLRSALRIFDRIVVAVGYNHAKQGLLTPEQRVQLIRESVESLIKEGNDIEVVQYTGLTAELCKRLNIPVLIRGLRMVADFDSEYAIAHANSKLWPQLQTVFVPASLECAYVSSSIVKDVWKSGGDVAAFMPPGVDLAKYLG